MGTANDMKNLKEVLTHNTMALSVRDKQNLFCIDQFKQGGFRARRRFLECVPHYVSFVGKSLGEIRKEMEDFDWDAQKKKKKTEVEDPSTGSPEEMQIMKLGGFETVNEVRAYIALLNTLENHDDYYHGRLYDMDGYELRHLTAEDIKDPHDPPFRTLRFVWENFIAVYEALPIEWLPESRWEKSGQEAIQSPRGRRPKPGYHLKAIGEADETPSTSSGDNQDGSDDNTGLSSTRLTQDLIDSLLEEDDKSYSRKGKGVLRKLNSAQREAELKLSHSWYEKAGMNYWQAEALFTSRMVQTKIEAGLRQAHWIAKKLGWEKDIKDAEQCF